MPQPRLTFACELSSERLEDLFADRSIIAGLRALNSRVALALAAFTPERAGVVRRLNDEGVPVVAIPLLSFDEGYYFTADNFLRAADRYEEWKAWTDEQRLVWDGVGLDIEPDVRLYQQIADNPWGVVPMLLPRILQRDRPRRAAVAYAGLVARIRADGWQAENYQFPLIADERRAGSDLLQRLAGLVEVTTDREVWMLYSSFLRSVGPGMIWSYARRPARSRWAAPAGRLTFPGIPRSRLWGGTSSKGISCLPPDSPTTCTSIVWRGVSSTASSSASAPSAGTSRPVLLIQRGRPAASAASSPRSCGRRLTRRSLSAASLPRPGCGRVLAAAEPGGHAMGYLWH